ncbi:suppressor of fused domain protein [Sphingobacterium sp. CZ-2]|uniref:suppressor of fused domain protein n=1 Tax=Sphingobacterium sp. CZ-2 TaxID=2557994 RepID=UPI00106FF5E2|nr:suppressor of fused domain protein [Sphingobacterium sp. CZ-2]QBR13176.1 hypothetical protein E3D81_13780 [Sphingobacterium sp. CZ-2]
MAFSKPGFLKSPLEHYRDSMESVMGKKSAVFREKSVKKGLPFVYTLVFNQDTSEPLCTFSYGASFAVTPDQKEKVELMLQMDSEDMAWAHVVGYLANQLRGDCPFNPGEIIRFGQKISQESKLNSFVLVTPDLDGLPNPVFDGKKSTGVHIMQLLPIYEEEVLSIARLGLPQFLALIDPHKTNPLRKSF